MSLLRNKKLIAFSSYHNSENGQSARKKKGIPQGSPMSAVLSNIYLLEFDRKIKAKSLEENFYYRRYCDDLLIICRCYEVDRLKNYVMDLIHNEYELAIQDRKTDIVDFRPHGKYGSGHLKDLLMRIQKNLSGLLQIQNTIRTFNISDSSLMEVKFS